MTEQELLIAVVSYDANELAVAFATLSEDERKVLHKELAKFQKHGLKIGSFSSREESLHKEYRWLAPYFDRAKGQLHWNTGLAQLALGTLSDVKNIGMGMYNETSWPALVKVLEDRRPSWADQWLEHLLRAEKRGSACWGPMRELIVRGVCKKPAAEGYYHLLAGELARFHWSEVAKAKKGQGSGKGKGKDRGRYLASDSLRDNPELLEDAYEILRLGSYALTNHADPWKVRDDWGDEPPAHALRRLAGEGLLDRRRLLEASLDGLTGEHTPQILARLSNFHEGMKPEKDEIVAMQPRYLGLLAAEPESVVSFAVKMLKKVDQARALDDAAYVESATPVLERKGKGLVKSVLTQFQKTGKRSPALVPSIVEAVTQRGLAHPDTDVQEACLSMLEAWKEHLDANVRDAIVGYASEIATTLRARAQALAGGTPEAQKPAQETPKAAKKPKMAVDTNVAGEWRTLAGVDAAIAAVETDSMPPPLAFDTVDVPVLAALAPVAPAESLDDIMAIAGRVVDGEVTAMEVEQLLDGISRIDLALEEDFARLAAPVLKRIEWPRGELGHLVHVWLTRGEVHEDFKEVIPPEGAWGQTFAQYYAHRVRAIRERIQAGVVAPLLALPTHEGGWIDARVLVARFVDLQRRKVEPEKYDLMQALLRLAPDGRAGAAAKLPGGKTAWERILRWVLTGEGAAQKGDDPDLWLAAFRARAPRAPMAVKGLENVEMPGPDGVVSAAYRLMTLEEMAAFEGEREKEEVASKRVIEQLLCAMPDMFGKKRNDPAYQETAEYAKAIAQERQRMDETMRFTDLYDSQHGFARMRLGLAVEPRWTANEVTTRPTLLLHAVTAGFTSARKTELAIGQASLCWPLNGDALYVSGLVEITTTLDERTSKNWPEYAYLTPLLGPERPITLPAALLVCLGLVTPQGDLSRTAIDVLVESISDGRAHPDTFAAPLIRLTETKWFQPGRLAGYLGEVARVSPLHAWVVAGILGHLAASWQEVPKNGHHILELLLELLARLGQALAPDASAALGGMKCSGKSAKLVKQLLSLEAVDNGAMAEAREMALQARIARAERWAVATA